MMQKAFTLIEVNLAILVMAGGILSVVVLYSLGFRESRQSREDLASAAYADAVLGPLVGVLSDRSEEMKWSTFDNLCGAPDSETGLATRPKGGWGGFLNSDGTVKENDDGFNAVSSYVKKPPKEECGYSGLVISHEKGSGLIKIGFRASKRLQDLLTAPLYYTEVRFQGVQD